LFLPFDLDQFEFADDPISASEQDLQFSQLNEMVRKVAYKSTNNVDIPRQANRRMVRNLQGAIKISARLRLPLRGPTLDIRWTTLAIIDRVRRSCRVATRRSAFFPFETAGDKTWDRSWTSPTSRCPMRATQRQ